MTIRLVGFSAIVLLGLAGCATSPISAPPSLADLIAKVDTAYGNLPSSRPAYNSAVREICAQLETSHPQEFISSLKKLDVSFDSPNIGLPLRHVEIPAPTTEANVAEVGIPVVLGYETKAAPLYPPEGLFVDATAIYDPPTRRLRFLIRSKTGRVVLNGRTYELATNPTGASDHLKLRARRLAASGFMSMIRPSSMTRKPQVYLLDRYDPNKTPLLMVHGLQSTPVAFATLVNALRSDPELRAQFQIWQFYYPSGTPVLANAAALRDSLNETLHSLDPKAHDAATKRIIVLGHSMGGVISHTLVSSSQDKLWASVFRVPPVQLRGTRKPSAI